MSTTTLALPSERTATDDELFADAIMAQDKASSARWWAADCYAELHGRGYTQQLIADRVGKAQSHISYCLRVVANYHPGDIRPDFETAYDEIKGNVHYSSETPEWETPQNLFDLLDAEFGFTLDVCATAENAKCDAFYTEEDDGLAQRWTVASGACWMNPPYGREIAAWIAKAHQEGDAGATVVCLVPARTDTDWFWDHARHGEVRLLHGRLRFGEAASGAPFPSAVVIFGRPPCVRWWDEWPPTA